jgi:N utilization substance protein A
MYDDIIEALQQIEREKDIPLDVLLETIESALVSAYRKNYGFVGDVRVRLDPEKGGFEVLCQKEVAAEVGNEHTEISLTEARTYAPDAQVGDTMEIEVTPSDFSRIAAQTAKQVVMQHIREVERERVYDEFSEKVGQVITGTVQRREGRSVLINLGRIEALMPPSEQVPTEPYRFNERLKVYVVEVRRTPRGPQIIVSRTHPRLVRGLFETEVPEIGEGIVAVKAIAREPGARSKVAVASSDDRVDPVGACVGHRGSRVQAVVDELYNEKIDIVRWAPEPARFVGEALSPAKVNDVTTNDETKSAFVVVADTQLSLAIGKAGQNVRLAAKLTGWRIDIRSESQIEAGETGEAAKAAAVAEPTPDETIRVETDEEGAPSPAGAGEEQPSAVEEAPEESGGEAAAEAEETEPEPEEPIDAPEPEDEGTGSAGEEETKAAVDS